MNRLLGIVHVCKEMAGKAAGEVGFMAAPYHHHSTEDLKHTGIIPITNETYTWVLLY